MTKLKVAALWTGGKDSSLACFKAMREHNVEYLVTFIWDKPSLAHPRLMMKAQSEATKIPFHWSRIQPPYKESYRNDIIELRDEYGIEGVVTGDISYVDAHHGNWIDDVCKGTGVEVLKPLWEHDRQSILNELLANNFTTIFTCVKQPWMTEDWLGRALDKQSVEDLKELHRTTGLDLCGENGEYHTMVLDAPYFEETVEVPHFTKEKTKNGFIMKPSEIVLRQKHRH